MNLENLEIQMKETEKHIKGVQDYIEAEDNKLMAITIGGIALAAVAVGIVIYKGYILAEGK